MHKKALSVVLCVLVLAGVCTAVLAAGGADDPLISASWLYETLMPKLREMPGKETAGLTELSKEYASRLDAVSFEKRSGQESVGKPVPLQLQENDVVTLDEFCTFLLTDGKAKLRCHDCEVIDLSDGSLCEDGCWLLAKHRYFAAEGSGASILCYSAAQGYADGDCLRKADTIFPAADRYTDIAGHWGETYICRMTEIGAVNGMETHLFDPDGKVTRAMFITVLCRIFGDEDGWYAPAFIDVKNGEWYTPYINWAAASGLVFGYGEGYFGPDDPITREQMATILVRCCERFGFALPYEEEASGYIDEEKISDWAREAVETARKVGLLQGRETGEFDPAGTASRAEMCAVFWRLHEKTE